MGMRKDGLNKREWGICERMKQIREATLDLTQSACARPVGGRWSIMLCNEARMRGKQESEVWRQFARCLLDAEELTFRGFMGYPRKEEDVEDLAWVEYLLANSGARVGPMWGNEGEKPKTKANS